MNSSTCPSNAILVVSVFILCFENSPRADGNKEILSLWPGMNHSPVTMLCTSERFLRDLLNNAPPERTIDNCLKTNCLKTTS